VRWWPGVWRVAQCPTLQTEPLAAGFPLHVLWQPVYSPGQRSPMAIVDSISDVMFVRQAGLDVEAVTAKLLKAP
jgi:hypothetical protein